MKQLACFVSYLGTLLLWVVANPRGLWQTIAQSGGQVLALARRLRKQEQVGEPTAVSFSLPFAAEWLVVNGGVEPQTSHSWWVVSQRYAYDFVMIGADGKSYAGTGTTPQAYHCFGQPILAAADGQVVALRNDITDYGRCQNCAIDWQTPDLRGNYVTIKHAEGVYSVSAHLQRGSIAVQAGQPVQAGQMIGRCGNSGHSTEPHLHFQVQDHPDFFLAVGLPIPFRNFSQRPVAQAEAETAVAQGTITKGHLVRGDAAVAGILMPPVNHRLRPGELLNAAAVFGFGTFGLVYLLFLLFGWLGRLLF